MDHEHNQGYIVVNCMITDGEREEAVDRRGAKRCFDYYFNMARFEPPKGKQTRRAPAGGDDGHRPAANTNSMVQTGQAAHRRRGYLPGGPEPDADRSPAPTNRWTSTSACVSSIPSPYMFYLNMPNTDPDGIESRTEPAGQWHRATARRDPPDRGDQTARPNQRPGSTPDTDFRYEAELKLDRKELAEHMMLVDLARNDIARVADPGQPRRQRTADRGKIRIGPAPRQQRAKGRFERGHGRIECVPGHDEYGHAHRAHRRSRR